MSELKNAWKQTAKSVVLALNDLSISLYKTAKAGIDVAVEWARKDNPHVQAEGTEIPQDDAVQDEAPAEAPTEAPVGDQAE